MKITVNARQMEVPADFRELSEKKIAKLDKYFRDDANAYITLSKKRGKEILELTISSCGTLYRSEEEDSTFNNALDTALDVIERQIRKNKTRLEKRIKNFTAEKYDIPDIDEENEFKIRVKSFSINPMSPEEAILQMNLLGHSFFVFENDITEEINVVYKRKDNNYGMIVPKK